MTNLEAQAVIDALDFLEDEFPHINLLAEPPESILEDADYQAQLAVHDRIRALCYEQLN